MGRSSLPLLLAVVSLSGAAAQAQQYQSPPVPAATPQGIVYRSSVSLIQRVSRTVTTWATCDEDVYFREYSCDGPEGCHYTDRWLFQERNRGGVFEGSRCERGDGHEYVSRNVKWVVRNAVPTRRRQVTSVETTRLASHSARQAECVELQSRVAREALAPGTAGQALAELLAVRTVDVRVTHNAQALRPDESLRFGPAFSGSDTLVLEAVLNSGGECRLTSAEQLRSELAARAAGRFPEAVRRLTASGAPAGDGRSATRETAPEPAELALEAPDASPAPAAN